MSYKKISDIASFVIVLILFLCIFDIITDIISFPITLEKFNSFYKLIQSFEICILVYLVVLIIIFFLNIIFKEKLKWLLFVISITLFVLLLTFLIILSTYNVSKLDEIQKAFDVSFISSLLTLLGLSTLLSGTVLTSNILGLIKREKNNEN